MSNANSGSPANPVRTALMMQYGFTARQLTASKLEAIEKCTELGMEILLIMMRLERDTSLTETAAAGVRRRGLRRAAARREKRESEAQRQEKLQRRNEQKQNRHAWTQLRALAKGARRMPVTVPVKPLECSDEDDAAVRRMVEIATRATARTRVA